MEGLFILYVKLMGCIFLKQLFKTPFFNKNEGLKICFAQFFAFYLNFRYEKDIVILPIKTLIFAVFVLT